MNHLSHQNRHVYGAQFRSMHDAIHRIAIFEKAVPAKRLVKYIQSYETLPEQFGVEEEPLEIINIDFRNPPTEFKSKKLAIINDRVIKLGRAIPDAY